MLGRPSDRKTRKRHVAQELLKKTKEFGKQRARGLVRVASVRVLPLNSPKKKTNKKASNCCLTKPRRVSNKENKMRDWLSAQKFVHESITPKERLRAFAGACPGIQTQQHLSALEERVRNAPMCGHSTPRGKEKRIGMVRVPDGTWKVVRQEDTKLTGAQELLQKQNEFGLNSETASHARFEWCENSIC